MPITNPWLAGMPDGVLPRPELEERILNLLSSQNMAVIATTRADGAPAATPVRYYSLGFEIMYTSWNESPKSANLRRDPRISVGIFAPFVGWRAAEERNSPATPARSNETIPRSSATGRRSAGSRTMSKQADRSTNHRPTR